MANRIKDFSTTASATASDDFFAIDGATNNSRKFSAYSPEFGGNVTIDGTLVVKSGGLSILASGLTISKAAWGLNGPVLNTFNNSTLTDTTNTSGTVAAVVAVTFGQPTFAISSGAVTYTHAANVYIASGINAASGVTCSNSWSLWVAGRVYLSSTGAINGGTSGDGALYSLGAIISEKGFATAAISQSYSSWLTTGVRLLLNAATFTNNSTASGTVATAVFDSHGIPTLAATNAGITTTDAATVYIAGGPAAGTNMTITNSWGLWNAGKTKFSADVYITHASGALYLGGSNPKISASTAGASYQDLTIEGNGVVIQAAANNNGVTLKSNGSGHIRVQGGSSTPNSFLITTSDWANLSAGTQLRFGFGAATGNTYGVMDCYGGGGGSAAGNIYIGGTGAFIGLTGQGVTLNSFLQVAAASNFSFSQWGTVGKLVSVSSTTLTDSSTAASGTAAVAAFVSFANQGLGATNATVTTTDAAVVYIAGNVTASTNMTITNAWGLWNVGNTRLDGNLSARSNVKLGSGTVVAIGAQAVVVDAGSEMRLQLNSTDRPGIYLTVAGANAATIRSNLTTFEVLVASGGTPISITSSTFTTDRNLVVSGTGTSSFAGQTRVASLGVGNSAAAVVGVGTIAKKIEVFDTAGASLGFVPVYTTIT